VKNKNILTRQLGLFDSAMMMGIVIGSGIFLTTGIMALAIPSASLIFPGPTRRGVILSCP